MFIVSTVRGMNIVFNDIADLEQHVSNLQAYLETCRASTDHVNPPVYGIYPNDYSPTLAKLMTKALQYTFGIPMEDAPEIEEINGK